MTTQSVQVKIELGHKASLRRKSTTEGFTHDWTIFVRGPEGSNIQHFVEKCIFHLHDSFPKPKRVVKEPPYRVSESGYGSFNLPVEIYFKTKEEPRKIRFDYDLFLHLDGSPPVNHVRCEKLTFQNPTEEFRRKLIKAGGVGILGPNDGITVTSNSSTPPTASTTPQTAESKAFTELFGAPIQAECNSQSKHSEGSHSKKHKSHSKDKDRDRERSKEKSKSHSALPPGAGGHSTPVAKPTTPPTSSSSSHDKPAKDKSKRTSEEISVVDVPAKKKKKDKDRDRERSKSSSGTSSREKEKHGKDKSSKSSAAAPDVKVVSPDKGPEKEHSKEKHRHKDSSSGSHSKSHKKSHKQKHGDRSKVEEESFLKPEGHLSPPASKSPIKVSKSPSKNKDHSQAGYKKSKSGSATQVSAAAPVKPQLPPLELSTGEASDSDPFEDDPPVLSPDVLGASQEHPKVSALADSRSKDFMKSLFDEMDSEDAMDDDDEDADMEIEVITPPKVSPAKVSSATQPVQVAAEPSEALIPTQNSPRSHTPSTGSNSISPRPDKHGKPLTDNSKRITPDKSYSTHSAESVKRHKSHTSPSSSPPTLTSQRSRSEKEKSSSHKHRESNSGSSKRREGDHREREPKAGTASTKKRETEQDPAATSTPKNTAPSRKKEAEVTKDKDITWDLSPPTIGPARRREPEPTRDKDPAPPTWSGSQNSILAKSNKISPPRFSMDPPDLLKSTQHSDLFGFQSAQRSLPELEKENQGDNHVTNGNSSISKTPLLENGTDIAETQLVPGHAPNGEAFELLLALQSKLNATKDESILSEVVHILEDSGEVFSMTDASLDFDLCYLNSNTVHRLKQCLQLS